MTNNAEREGFVREGRYVVIKIKQLDDAQKYALSGWLTREEISTIECVVIEHDWPEYELVWAMIEARMTGQARAHASGVPDGYVLVPRVPTDAMRKANRTVTGFWCDWKDVLAAAPTPPKSASVPVERLDGELFQSQVGKWMEECFSPSLYSNETERVDRFMEEAIELAQSLGYDRSRIRTLVNYVYNRPVGAPYQEIGGVMITLAGLCHVIGLDMQSEGEHELERINQSEVKERIKAKQAAKNALHFDTPLPGFAGLNQVHDSRLTVSTISDISPLFWIEDKGQGRLRIVVPQDKLEAVRNAVETKRTAEIYVEYVGVPS